jgi:hypothetical protein
LIYFVVAAVFAAAVFLILGLPNWGNKESQCSSDLDFPDS